MFRPLLFKTLLLLVALVVVSGIIVSAIGGRLGPEAPAAGRTQTFFAQFVMAGGPIVWFVLLPMSLITVYLTAEYALTIRRKELLPAGTADRIVRIMRRSGPGQLGALPSDSGDLVATAVLRAVSNSGGDGLRMRNLLFESLEQQGMRLLRKIEWVNLIGNVSPMVGLFGTVFGMIKLFNAIVTAGGQPQPAQLADGISVALVTTFWGLLIAIPALAVYGVFRSRIETLLAAAAAEAENVLGRIVTSRVKPPAPQRPAKKRPLDVVVSTLDVGRRRAFDKSATPS